MSVAPNLEQHTFQRDKSSSALINTDKEGLLLHRSKREKAKADREYREQTDAKIELLSKQVSEIHSMFQQLLERTGK